MNDNCEDEDELRRIVLWRGVNQSGLRKKVFPNAAPGSVSAIEKDLAVELVAACLRPDPASRPQSILELRQLTYFRSHEAHSIQAKLLFVSTPGKGRNPCSGYIF